MIVDNSAWNIYNFRMPLVKALRKAGYELIIATPVDEYIHYLNDTYFTRHIQINHLDRNGKNPINDLMFFFELICIYKKEKPDLIFHFTIKANIYGCFAARLFSIPSIAVITGLGYTFLHPEESINRFIPLLYRFSFKKSAKVIVYNKDDYNLFINKKIVSKEQCIVVPGDGINTNFFRPIHKNKDENKFIFLFIGRLLKDKGIQTFVQASRKLKELAPQSESWVIGDLNFGNPADVKKDELLKWINDEDIIYNGSTKDIRQFMKSADVLVLPSKREGLPRVILEAMSMGKPVIASDVAGCREAINHNENGLLVPVDNTEALQEAMMFYYELNENSLKEIGKRNRKKILLHYHEKASTDAFLKIIGSHIGINKREKVEMKI